MRETSSDISDRVHAQLLRTETMLERLGGTAEARAATMRAAGRTARDLGTRLKRAVIGMGLTGTGVAGVGLASAAIGGMDTLIAAAIAVPAAGLIGAALPTRRRVEPAKLAQTPLARLAADAEAWLAARRRDLPRSACAAADRVSARLTDLQPLLAERSPGDAEAIEARRLIADHLPRLMNAYLAVPLGSRGPEVEREVASGLTVVADELERLRSALAATKLDALRTEGRFLEAKYKDGP